MKIAVVGSINMDMTVSAPRIPLKGETILGESLAYASGGKGANQAVAMARQGCDVWMFGCVGDDANGQLLLTGLEKNGVHTEHIRTVKNISSGLAVITVGEHDNSIVVIPGANKLVDVAYIQQMLPVLLTFDAVVLQLEIPLGTVEFVVESCYAHDIPVFLNPAPAAAISQELVDKVAYLIPNAHEAQLIFPEELSPEALVAKYPEKLIITLGSQGCLACLSDGRLLKIPAAKVRPVDTTGAGDTFHGVFAVRRMMGDRLADALLFANYAAGISTQQHGAQDGMPTEAQVRQCMHESS